MFIGPTIRKELREAGGMELREQYFAMFGERYPFFNHCQFSSVEEYVEGLKRSIAEKTVYVPKCPFRTPEEIMDEEYRKTHNGDPMPQRKFLFIDANARKLLFSDSVRQMHKQYSQMFGERFPSCDFPEFSSAEEYVEALRRSVEEKKRYVRKYPIDPKREPI